MRQIDFFYGGPKRPTGIADEIPKDPRGFYSDLRPVMVLDKNGKPQKVREASGAKRQIDPFLEYDKRLEEVRPAINQAIQNSPEFKALKKHFYKLCRKRTYTSRNRTV